MTNGTPKHVLAAYRKFHAQRFRRDRDWLRLFILASCLFGCSVLAIADALVSAETPGVIAGSPAIFGGLTIAIFITKIARADTYADWILSAALYVGVGFSLLAGETCGEVLLHISFPTLLIAAGAVRIWVGLTVEPENAGAWLCSSGYVAIVGGLIALAGSAFATLVSLREILAVDLLFLSISIARFGMVVRYQPS